MFPGMRKFISNMTAGVVGMDLVLLVIAADEGSYATDKRTSGNFTPSGR